MVNVETYTYKQHPHWDSLYTAGGSDKMEVKDQNVQTNTLEMKDQKIQTKFVQVKNQQVQAESTTQQQGMC